MFQRIRKYLTPSTAIAFMALVFAVTGGAFAATGSGGSGSGSHATLTASAAKAKASPKGKAGPRGATGAKGATGATGAAGPAGAMGPAGATGATGATGPAGAGTPGASGTDGTNGTNGERGSKGEKGEKGEPWPAGGTLPNEATETGVWVAAFGAKNEELGNFDFYASISFPVPLAASLKAENAIYVTLEDVEKGEIPTGCSGSAEQPAAAAGNLCVFEGPSSTSTAGVRETSFIARVGATSPFLGASPTGAMVVVESAKADAKFVGSFAVTAG